MFLDRLRYWVRQVFVPPRTTTERNIYYLYIEIVFVSLLSVAGSFNSAYILRSGGSNTLVGLLSSLPSLVAMLLFIPAAQVLERKKNYMPWLWGSLLLTRAGYVVILLLPFLLPRYVPELTVAVLVAMTAPSVFYSVAWSPMLSEVVPARSRSTVFSWRSILNSAIIAPLVLITGRALEATQGHFPRNYQVMYLIGFLGSAASVYLISHIRPPDDRSTPAPTATTGRGQWLTTLRAAMRENPRFGRIVANTLLFDFGAWFLGPLYIIFFVRQLGATDGWIGLNSTLANIGVISGYWVWRRIIRRLGEARCLLVALPLASVYPFMVALLPNLPFILFAGFFINLTSPGVSLSHSMIFLELLPEGKKHTFTAIYSTVMNIGAFVGPLIGVAVANAIGIVPTLLIGGTMRLSGAALFYLYPIKDTRAQAQPS
jgi:Na+/melibiose symporter-like transporter